MAPAPSRFLPMVSISSINTMQGAFSLACLKRSRTLAAPMPTNISTNSEPEIEKKGTLASPATALASRVLPVPGGPTSSAPRGMRAPISAYFCGLCKKSTISVSSSLASSSPATSAKRMPSVDCTYTLALLLPKDMKLPPGPPAPARLARLFISTRPSTIKSTIGSTQLMSILASGLTCWMMGVPYWVMPAS